MRDQQQDQLQTDAYHPRDMQDRRRALAPGPDEEREERDRTGWVPQRDGQGRGRAREVLHVAGESSARRRSKRGYGSGEAVRVPLPTRPVRGREFFHHRGIWPQWSRNSL